MPGKLLSAPPEAGFFGKLPSTGDFVARGLPSGFRKVWDQFVTRHLAQRLRDPGTGKAGGLRFRLESGGRVAAGVILPSGDSAGRRFPLTLVLIGADLPGPAALDPWCDQAADLVGEGVDLNQLSPDDLLDQLDGLPLPDAAGETLSALMFWTKGQGALNCDPTAPDEVLDQLLGSVVLDL